MRKGSWGVNVALSGSYAADIACYFVGAFRADTVISLLTGRIRQTPGSGPRYKFTSAAALQSYERVGDEIVGVTATTRRTRPTTSSFQLVPLL